MGLQNNNENENKWFDEICERLGIHGETKNTVLLTIESNRKILGHPTSFNECEVIVKQAFDYAFNTKYGCNFEVDTKDVGVRIKNIRHSLDLNLEQFASLIDRTANRSTVRNWENGMNLPKATRLVKIARLGNITVDYLLTGENNGKLQ